MARRSQCPPTMTITNENIIAGAAAEGHGAIIGWKGEGELTRAQLLQALAAAGLPAAWAPEPKSSVAQAGRAVASVADRSYRTSRAPAVKGATWAARWIVEHVNAASAQVGDAAGSVVLTVELSKGGELTCQGRRDVATEIETRYAELTGAELYQAGDVTGWLRQTLYQRAGATAFGIGYYVKADGRDVASRLAAAMVELEWGSGWIAPLLPVATSDELRIGIARGLTDDVRRVAASLESERAAARRDDRTEIRPGQAAALLRELAEVDTRTDAYLALCGAEIMAPTVAEMRALHATLSALCDASAVRFAMVEMNDGTEVVAAVEPTVSGAVQRAADAALAVRRETLANVPVERQAELFGERLDAATRAAGIEWD